MTACVRASAQVFLQLDTEAKKQLEAMQKEIGAVKAAVAAADPNASLDQLGGGQVKRTILDLYYRNAKLKVTSQSHLHLLCKLKTGTVRTWIDTAADAQGGPMDSSPIPVCSKRIHPLSQKLVCFDSSTWVS